MKKIKVVQIGAGHDHAPAALNCLLSLSDIFEVVGYVFVDDGEQARKCIQNEQFKNLKQLTLEEAFAIPDLDAAVIETDDTLLTKYTRLALERGLAVQMDKPGGQDEIEFNQTFDYAKDKNLVLHTGYMYRYNPSIREAFYRIKAGELGSIHSIVAEMSTRHSDEYRKWLGHFSGGNMYIFGSHLVDLILLLLGEPKDIQSHIGSSGVNGVDSPDISTATLIYDHAVARIFVSSVECNGWGRRCFSVAGSDGTLEIRPLEVPVKMTFAKKGEGKEYFEDYAKELPTVALSDSCRYDEMIEDLYKFVTGQKENPYSYEHEYLVRKVLDRIVGGLSFNV